MQGMTLIKTLVQQTGLPSEYLEPQLIRLIENRNLKPENINLNCIRDLLGELLMKTFEELVDEPVQK